MVFKQLQEKYWQNRKGAVEISEVDTIQHKKTSSVKETLLELAHLARQEETGHSWEWDHHTTEDHTGPPRKMGGKRTHLGMGSPCHRRPYWPTQQDERKQDTFGNGITIPQKTILAQ